MLWSGDLQLDDRSTVVILRALDLLPTFNSPFSNLIVRVTVSYVLALNHRGFQLLFRESKAYTNILMNFFMILTYPKSFSEPIKGWETLFHCPKTRHRAKDLFTCHNFSYSGWFYISNNFFSFYKSNSWTVSKQYLQELQFPYFRGLQPSESQIDSFQLQKQNLKM